VKRTPFERYDSNFDNSAGGDALREWTGRGSQKLNELSFEIDRAKIESSTRAEAWTLCACSVQYHELMARRTINSNSGSRRWPSRVDAAESH
jgi:hypothetical protein